MAKGDDVARRKKNKANRKKLNKKIESSSHVSARIAAIIAAKNRRKSGKRRMCQGMCFSLPTPEDPFNEREGKKDFKRKETEKIVPLQEDEKVFVKEKSAAIRKRSLSRNNPKLNHQDQVNEMVASPKNEQNNSLTFIDDVGQSPVNMGRTEIQMGGNGGVCGHQTCGNSDCPSKFLLLGLNAIENMLCLDGTCNSDEGMPFFVNTWGVEFWKCHSVGKDVLETSGSNSTVEQIAWIASTAADTIARKEKEGLSFTSPFLLFLVPSQEKAAKVRLVCKPLKSLGIHTVSLHPGASIDHQINGLKSCEPEFLVSTPERLWELVSLKAIDISGVSMLVVDGLESLCRGGYLDIIKSIRQSISGKPHTVVFNDGLKFASVPAVQNLLMGSIYRLSLNDSVASQSACIIQSVNVCVSEEEKLSKGIQVLDHACGNQRQPQPLKVLYVVGRDSKFQKLASALNLKGYAVSAGSNCNISEVKNSLDSDSTMRPAISVIDTKHISTADLGEYKVVVIPDFVLSIETYVQILTRMARHTVNGILHSFLTKDDAPHAAPLIEILEQCGQAVPEGLRNLSLTSSMMES